MVLGGVSYAPAFIMPFSKKKPDTKRLFIMLQTKKFKLLRKTSLTNAPKFVEAHIKI